MTNDTAYFSPRIQMKISFIICSHRAPASIMDTVRSLGGQTRQETAEVVIVNNGFSNDRGTQVLAEASKSGWSSPFRIVPEPIPGLGYSRKRGFLEAKGEWFVLLDDDNTIDPDFLERLNEKISDHPDLGGITPLVSPIWEKRPAEWMERFGANCLSYNSTSTFQKRPLDRFYPAIEALGADRPPGGGMVIHRSVARNYLENADDPLRLSLARTGTSLVGCEDQDMWRYVAILGLSVLVTDTLKVQHHIPRSRLNWKYLLRLNYQMAYSYRVLDRLLRPSQPRPLMRDLGHRLLQTARHLKIGLTTGFLFLHVLEIAKDFGNFSGGRKRLDQDSKPSKPSP